MQSHAQIRPARVNPVLRHDHEQRLSLDGEWRFQLDPEDLGVAAGWWRTPASFAERIMVPGCWQGQGFGGEGEDTLWDFRLSARVFQATYRGTGWYGRTFRLPEAWQGRRLWLNLGGAHPSADVWLNGAPLGGNALPFVPFAFEVTPHVRWQADNEVAVRVHEQNREFGLAYNWQGNWSGLYRGVEVTATGPLWFERCALLPEVDSRTLRLRLTVGGTAAGLAAARLQVRAAPTDGSRPAASAEFACSGPHAEFALPLPEPRLWSPEQPHLYRVDLALLQGDVLCDARSERTGFVKLAASGTHLCINGEPYYLRGSGDFLSCPETGCPDTDRQRWRRKLKALRDYGYTYVRCQSYVYGPEYYDVADEVGLLVQSEMGLLGGWAGQTPWHVYAWPKPTADNLPTLKAQWDLVVERDASHPSANLYCMSNELGAATDFPRLAWQGYRDTRAAKPTALVIWTDGGWSPDLPGDFVNHNLTPAAIATCPRPVIEHEYRWWSSFPDVRLRQRYVGAVRPYAADLAAAAAARQGQSELLETYASASQRLQFLEAKAKMETLRRDSPALAGICHFNAMDTNPSPQGIINEFYEGKVATAERWRETNGDTVVLCSLGFEDRCLAAGETLRVRFFVSDFAHPPLHTPCLGWRLVAGATELAAGDFACRVTPFCTCPLGEIEVVIPELAAPVAARLEVRLSEEGRAVTNRWDLWLFPAASPLPSGVAVYGEARHTWLKDWPGLPTLAAADLDACSGTRPVVLSERLDAALERFMRAGGRAILAAGEGLLRPHPALFGYVRYFFTPPANYAPYEDGQNGTVITPHPMLGDLPHEGFADWQFFRLIETSPPLDLGPLGLDAAAPVLRVIHRYPVLRPLAYLTEAACGQGGLILCALGMNPAYVEARYLLSQWVRYAAGPAFRPAQEISPACLRLGTEASGR